MIVRQGPDGWAGHRRLPHPSWRWTCWDRNLQAERSPWGACRQCRSIPLQWAGQVQPHLRQRPAESRRSVHNRSPRRVSWMADRADSRSCWGANGNTRCGPQEPRAWCGRRARDAPFSRWPQRRNGRTRCLYSGCACIFRNDIRSPSRDRKCVRRTGRRVRACMCGSWWFRAWGPHRWISPESPRAMQARWRSWRSRSLFCFLF